MTRLLVLALWLLLAGPALAQDPAGPAADPAQPSGVISVEDGAATDQAIRQRITAILSQIEAYDRVRVRVESGIVTLTGEALDSATVDRLNRLVARVNGVVEIDNRVTETTDVTTRLESVGQRFAARIEQTAAYLPLLLVALVAAIAIAALGHLATRWHGFWNRLAPNPFIADIIRQVVRLASYLVGGVVALDILGATALLGTFLGAAGIIGIALGFAVRDTVENFVASVLLSLRQPFRPNDLVDIEGQLGRVIRLTSRATTLLSLDGNHVRIPNSTVFKAVITNYSRNPERRFSFDLRIGAGSDLAVVRELGLETLRSLDFVLNTPAPAVWVSEVTDSGVVVRFTGWVTQRGAEFSLARGEAIRVVKEAVGAAGFGLPEPIYQVNLRGEDKTAETDLTETAPPDAAARGTAPPTPIRRDDCPPADLAPDHALDRMVAEEQDAPDREPNLLSPDAPQE
ncbi:mechanosensitive ion channel family protein [uncultured Paracoccus sp.]|uniref:mechanosensitive ion channel family protein n=1 Tax=uncultured Paracoccus sp. TaxID=189685 RepID=UPI00261834D5|nr:mechanosensitive ion channel family protein [uncultured Paracoccus sp.]